MEQYAHIARDGRTQSIREHLETVAAYAEGCLTGIGLGKTAYYCGIVHDLGKYTAQFEEYLKSNGAMKRGSVNHTFAGVRMSLQLFHHEPPQSLDDVACEILAYAVGAHHGQFDLVDAAGKNGFEHRMRKTDIGYEEAAANYCAKCVSEKELAEYFNKACTELVPIIEHFMRIAAEREGEIGNDETYFYISMLARLLLSAVIEGDRRDTAEFMNNRKQPSPKADWKEVLDRVERKLTDFSCSNEIQKARREISDYCRESAELPAGVYRLNVPTGAGKTLSGLRYALAHAATHGMNRIIFTSPLLSILDQNAAVVREYVGDDSIILEHHSNVIREESGDDDLSESELLAESWSSPIVITTMVQLLNTLFAGKTSCIRRFQALCKSVVVIDEVQTVPRRMLTLFNLAVNFLAEVCGATVLLCSATQPTLEDAEHPLNRVPPNIVPYKEEIWKTFKRTTIRPDGQYQQTELGAYACRRLENARSLLIICNTKKQAADVYRQITGLTNEEETTVYHLSAGMCMAHRRRTIGELQSSLQKLRNGRGKKIVCVSTQVIEAGVDISFQCVIRLAAGLDSVIQSAGRCNRNRESEEALPVYLVQCLDENISQIRDIKDGKDALLNVLASMPQDETTDFASDAVVQRYYRTLYRGMPKRGQDGPTAKGKTIYGLLSIDGFDMDNAVNGKYALHQAFDTAGKEFRVFDEDNSDVIVPYGEGKRMLEEYIEACEAYDFEAMKKALERLKPYTVSIYDNQRRKLEQIGALCRTADGNLQVLAEPYYDDRIGIKEEAETEAFFI